MSLFFLATTRQPPPPATYPPTATKNGGLRLPPFPPRTQLHVAQPPVCYMNEEQANKMKHGIFQLLDQFEESPPFTIQRLCELCVEPKKHYKSVGKYLRAVEKSILVTSAMDSFPPLTLAEKYSAGRSAITLGSTLQSAPSTPLFSPISFLHDDARRSKSRSPPPTLLALDGAPDDFKALGLVDELDDPRPGHMSDHPTPLTAVMTLPAHQPKPFLGSLGQRFVKAEKMDISLHTVALEEGEPMDLDEDKENTKS